MYTLWSVGGRVFLSRWPWVISLMEAVFIGLLCYFDLGLESPFRFYYFLSLLVCAIRYSPAVTIATFALHSISYGELFFSHGLESKNLATLFVMLVSMGLVTWSCTSLRGGLTAAGRRGWHLSQAPPAEQSRLCRRVHPRPRGVPPCQGAGVPHRRRPAWCAPT